MIGFDNVAHSFGSSALLGEISLELAAGSFHFLTGPSGAGKSTFLKLCYGELTPTSGKVTFLGQDVSRMSRDGIAMMRQDIGVVHQDCQFLDHLTLAENVALPLAVAGRQTDQGELGELLGWVGLAKQAQALPPTLSGGERQRGALARAVIMSPKILLADEPSGNLDHDMSLRLLTLLVELNRMGTTIMVATHDLALIRAAKTQVSARVLRIKDRRLYPAGAEL